MATQLTLNLTPHAYSDFLVKFREADTDTANAAGHEIVVTYVGDDGLSYTYYYQTPNFKLCGYSIRNGARVSLTDYNYRDDDLKETAANRSSFIEALKHGGGGGTRMTPSLAKVIALTSEAARSKAVEQVMRGVIGDRGTANLPSLKVLFNDYGHVATFCRYRIGSDSYSPTWRAIDKSDYQRYYMQKDYSGDRKKMLDNVNAL